VDGSDTNHSVGDSAVKISLVRNPDERAEDGTRAARVTDDRSGRV
jgi:hypothetical protein